MSRRAALLALCLAACSSRHRAAPPPPAADARAHRPDAAVPRPPPANAITVDEVKPVLPVPAEARVVEPLHKQKGEERVQVAFCFDHLAEGAAAERVTAKLQGDGWQVERLRNDLHATHGALALSGMVRRGPWAACQGSRGQTYVLLAVHRP